MLATTGVFLLVCSWSAPLRAASQAEKHDSSANAPETGSTGSSWEDSPVSPGAGLPVTRRPSRAAAPGPPTGSPTPLSQSTPVKSPAAPSPPKSPENQAGESQPDEGDEMEDVIVVIPTHARRIITAKRFAALPCLLEGRGGIGTIVGLVGFTAAVDLGRIVLGGGAGISGGGPQMGAYARVRPLVFMRHASLRLHALGVEVGYSTGGATRFVGLTEGPTANAHWNWVHWIQPQLSYETRTWNGFSLLAGIGVAVPVARSGYHCLSEPSATPCSHALSAMPTLTGALGYAWGG